MIKEIWKPVVGYEGYEVSNLGRVKSLERYDSRGQIVHQRIMKEEICKNGYRRVCLGLGSRKERKHCLIHRLVAIAFIPNPNNYPCINHINEDKTDNRVENLEWCTHQYNNTYKDRLEKSAKKHNKKVVQYDLDMNLICNYNSITEAAKINNICETSIITCLKGRYKTAGGYIWKYAA